jgi:hypothetical protein
VTATGKRTVAPRHSAAPEEPQPSRLRWKHEDAASPSAGRPLMYETPVSVCGGFFVQGTIAY